VLSPHSLVWVLWGIMLVLCGSYGWSSLSDLLQGPKSTRPMCLRCSITVLGRCRTHQEVWLGRMYRWVIIIIARFCVLCARPSGQTRGPSGCVRGLPDLMAGPFSDVFELSGAVQRVRIGHLGFVQIGGFIIDVRMRLWLYRICVYRHPVKGWGLVIPICSR
jgi:hypothetical protein